jgi:mono/diheme cytochrome c family protein
MQKTRRRFRLAACVPLVLMGLPAGLQAADGAVPSDPLAAGRERFMLDCATCHGVDGSGNGPVAGVLKIQPPDLTRLASRNRGSFSYPDVYATIDGRQPLAHGTRDMPIWGNRYKQVLPALGEKKAHTRIDALVRYLESLQVP